MIGGYPLPDGADPDHLSWLDFARYEVPIPAGTPVTGYRIMKKKGDRLYPAFSQMNEFEHSYYNKSPTNRGYNYWADLNVAIQYAHKLVKTRPLGENEEYVIHHVSGYEVTKNFAHREGNVMDDMIIGEQVARFYT